MLYTEKRITGYIKKKTLRYQKKQKSGCRKLMHRSEEIQKHQKSGAESIAVWQPLRHLRDSDLWHNRRSCVYQCTYRSAWQCVRTAEPYDKRSL